MGSYRPPDLGRRRDPSLAIRLWSGSPLSLLESPGRRASDCGASDRPVLRFGTIPAPTNCLAKRASSPARPFWRQKERDFGSLPQAGLHRAPGNSGTRSAMVEPVGASSRSGDAARWLSWLFQLCSRTRRYRASRALGILRRLPDRASSRTVGIFLPADAEGWQNPSLSTARAIAGSRGAPRGAATTRKRGRGARFRGPPARARSRR